MANIVYRKVSTPTANAQTQNKGSPLTNDELDGNFFGMNAEIAQKPSLGSTVGTTLGVAAAGSATTAARSDHVHPKPTLTELGGTTIGSNMFTLTNPSSVRFPRFNADNTISALTAADFLAAIGGSSGGGTGNYVTLDTVQTITASKTFAAGTFTGTATFTKTPGINESSVTGELYSPTQKTHVTTTSAGNTAAESFSSFVRTNTIGGITSTYGVNYGIDSSNRFVVGGGSTGAATMRFRADTAGNFLATGNISAYSDARLKKDLVQIEGAIDKLKQLTGYTYTRIDSGERQTGLLAQDVQKVLPEAVSNEENTLAVSYGNMVGLLVEAIKEIDAKLNSIQESINSK